MSYKIIAVGELSGWSKLAYEEYSKRLKIPFLVQLIEIPTPKRNHKSDSQSAMQFEAKKIMAHIQPNDFVFALDQNGLMFTTEQFASQLNTQKSHNMNIVFVIGGPDGFHETIYKRANKLFSLSKLVLPHALARVVLIEQIYRAYTLFCHHPYHRP